MLIRFTILFSFITFYTATHSQATSKFEIGDKVTLRSDHLKEERTLRVYVPETSNNNPLPLILVLDAETLFEPTVTAMRFMTRSSEIPIIPEAVIIGVNNTDRNRDMPAPQQWNVAPNNFKKFIYSEVLAYARNHYNLNNHFIVIGHSQGGLFASSLLTDDNASFKWSIALDAPMNVDTKTKYLNDIVKKRLADTAVNFRYVSVEDIYGWGDSWNVLKANLTNNNLKQIKYTDGSHELMPYKGIYDGMKFLYNDYAPNQKDLNLSQLKKHFQSISVKYGYKYEIPLRTLLASAVRKQQENRKDEIMELLDYAENVYGKSERITALRVSAEKIKVRPDSLMEAYLKLPKPSPAQVIKYVGKWSGQITVPRGQNMPIDFEISIVNGQPEFITVLPWPPYNKVAPLFFAVDSEGRLIWGKKNNGGGIFIATAEINKDGILKGTEKWIGYTIPDDLPEDIKEMMRFSMANPNTLELKKQ